MTNLNPYKSPESALTGNERTLLRSPSRMIAILYGLFFLVVMASSMPSRLADDNTVYTALSILRDLLAVFVVFAFATQIFDLWINYKLWFCTTLSVLLFYVLGMRIDTMNSPEITLGRFAAIATLFTAIIGPALCYNFLLVLRLKRKNVAVFKH